MSRPVSRLLLLPVAFAAALDAPPARAGDAVLANAEQDVTGGLSLATGYVSLEVPDGVLDEVPVQVGARLILYRHWEFALDLRADFNPAAETSEELIDSYAAILWFAAHLDYLPLTVFLGVGGGAVFDGADWTSVSGTVGGKAGLALWFESSWRLTLHVAERWVLGPGASIPVEVLLSGEYFF